LPQNIPKGEPVIFQCQLGDNITKSIEIRNPSNKTVYYWVKIEGSKDFYFEDKDYISIEPKSSYNFNI
jgi:hypothetical protein